MIFETDDSSAPLNTDPTLPFWLDVDSPNSNQTAVLAWKPSPHPALNPYAHFGHPSVWPRGFPLEEVSGNVPEEVEERREGVSALIQQGLTNGGADALDSLFRMTRASR